MSFPNPPRTWTTGEIITAAILNADVKDAFRYLKGLDGAVTLSDSLILPDGAGKYIHIPILTTAQRDALTATAGMLIYNSTTTQFNKYENGAWRADLGFNSDHGNLTAASLLDDDHPQYPLKTILTTRGDIIYRDANTWARLAKGTAGYYLTMGANDPAWTAPPAVPSGGIIMWAGTIANIPSGYVICDGNNFTPNLLARFIQGVATAATNPGATGGAAGHRHPYEDTNVKIHEVGGADKLYHLNITDSRPPFYDVAFIMKT